jgi:uncharacterized protein (DUF1684 family)
VSANTSFPSSAERDSRVGDDEFATSWRSWHDESDRRRRDPHGVLAFTGLVWLTAQPQRIAGVPGLFSVPAGTHDVVIEATAADGLRLGRREGAEGDAEELDGITVLGTLTPHVLTFADGEVEIARRGAHVIARPRSAYSPLLAAFDGTPAYAPDAAWVVPARYEPWDQARRVAVDAATGRFTHELDAVGTVRLTLDGQAYELTAFAGFVPGTVRLPFRDATNALTTYGAGRNVIVDLPESGGEAGAESDGASGVAIVVDFTRAVNMPCAYSDFGTCPLPPAENRLDVPVTAGEKTPTLRLSADVDGHAVVARSSASTPKDPS